MPALPSGTVTFFFTDIAGSTLRWEQQPEAMQAALVRHDALLRSAIEAHGGYVFKTMGDSFCAAFATAPEAVAAAVAAQRALEAEPWGGIDPLRVRLALHTGTAEERDGDYFGPPLNRIARLLAAGHGGQTLLSLAVEELARDALPAGVTLKDLGEHRLKDLIRSERIFQLVIPDLPAEFPPLCTLDNRPNNLPAQATPLIGRERELAVVCRRLRDPDVRLLTLTGPGGTGKTRLGLQAAADLIDDFEHGVYFVALAPISDPNLVSSTVAQTLGVRESGGRPLLESLKDYLRDKQLLLVLDNFEQVLSAAPLVAELLTACHRLKLLVTSRAVLHVYGEHDFAVPPLTLPDRAALPPVERLTQYEAVRLFIERARAVKADFAVTSETAPAVAEICHRLDGLPLAIELAAARIRLLPPSAMLARLERRLPLLTLGARDLPARQQTLRGAIAWSYDLLEPEEQLLFRRLAVFVGGCTLEAAEAVCAGIADWQPDVLDGVSALVDKSLLLEHEGAGDEPRFVMLETVREYALERLEASGEAAELRQRHADYYLGLVERSASKLQGAEQEVWLARLEQAHDNLRAVLAWCQTAEGGAEQGLRLAGSLAWFWRVRGYFSEGQRWLEESLAACGQAPSAVRAKALTGAGTLARFQGDYQRAALLHEEALALLRPLGDQPQLAWALIELGIVRWRQADYGQARSLFDESLVLFRELGDRRGLAWALGTLGLVARDQGEYERAAALYEESLLLSRQIGDKRSIGLALGLLGSVAYAQGDYGRVAALYTESLALFQELADRGGIAWMLGGLGNVAKGRGDYARAARLFGAAGALLDAIGAPWGGAQPNTDEWDSATVRDQLGEATFTAELAYGRTMTTAQAIEYALSTDTPGASPVASRDHSPAEYPR